MAPPKKPQNQKMSLGDFLTDESLGSWADEMENMPVAPTEHRTGYGDRRAFSSTDRMGSAYDRPSYAREQLPLPDKPPFTAHIGNLSFDVTESDVMDYFAGCSVTNVRIVEDKLERKPKGFGYVEFGNVDGLKRALELNGTQFSGRNIRVSVAEPPKDRPETRDISDWTRKGPLPSLPAEQRRGSDRGYGNRNWDNVSDAGSDRADRRRTPFDQADGKTRDFGNWERKGPLSPLPHTGPGGTDGSRPRTRDGPRDRRQSPAWGEGRSQDGSRPPRKEFHDRPHVDRAPTAPEMDNQWRSKMRPDPPVKSPTIVSANTSKSTSPAAPPAPASRPKLNLQKRTVSEAESTSPASAVSEAKSSPFGGARPIDTSARDKEIEEKRQLALRQKKEQEEKAREEKRLAKEAAKAEKPAPVTEAPRVENGDEPRPVQSTSSNFEILRKAGAEGEDEGDLDDDETEVESKNGGVVEDKAVKPKEIVRELPPKERADIHKGGSSDGKASGQASEPPSNAELEGDGWSTVTSKSKNSRRGNHQAARAIAS